MSSELPDRRAIEQALRACGLSHRAARKFIAAGWRALVTESEAEAAELRDQLEDLRGALAQQVPKE